MTRRMKLFLFALTLCALATGAAWLSGGKSSAKAEPQPSAQDDAKQSNPLARLNAKARAARKHDEAAVRELVDESFNVAALNNAPAGMSDAIKDRLVRAELNWRRGATRGVSDKDVVKTINQLADKFNAPDYAHTNRYEVRRLHTLMFPYMPDFIGRENTGASTSKQKGSSINHERMSPLEAGFLMAMLLRQKQTNPDFQLTHDEQFAQWKERHSGKAKKDKKNDDSAQAQEYAKRHDAIANAISDGAAKMSPAELLNLPANMLDALGVER